MIPIIQTLGDQTVSDMLRRAQESEVRARQADAERRILMLQENWRHYVWAYIATIYKVPAVRDAVRRRVKSTYNVLQQICGRVCVAYSVPPIRELKGAPQVSQEAFARVMRESEISIKAKTWERITFASNVMLTVPRVVQTPGHGPRVVYDKILADRAEVYTDTLDPMGAPTRVVYDVKGGSDFSPDPLQTIVLDDVAWTYFDGKGRRIGRIAHNAGVCPATTWRLDDPIDDWWSSHRGQGIVDATIEVAHLAARMDWVRHSQDRKREYFAGEEIGKIPTQVAGNEGPTAIPLPPDAIRFDAFDVNTPIDNHRDHIQLYLRQAAEMLGVPAILVDFDVTGGAETERSVQQQSALAKLRNNHLDYYRVSEHDSAWKTALVMRGMGHPDARHMPPDMVRESFGISYPELTFVDHPREQAAVSAMRIKLGLSSTFREYRTYYPHLTFEQAREQVLEIAAEEGELNEFFIQHNIPRGADARNKTLAQLQGSIGGDASGVARQPQDQSNGGPAEPGRAAAAAADGNPPS